MARDKKNGRIEPIADLAGARRTFSSDVLPGPLASLDTTLPPTPLKKLLAADGASIYVLTADRELIDTVHAAAGDQYPVYDLTEWEVLLDLVDGGRCRIVLLDADLVSIGMEKRISRLQQNAGGLVVLVAANRDVAQSLIGLMSERSIHRLLIKPAAAGITRLLLESAVSRYLQLRDAGPDDKHSARPQGGDASAAAARPRRSPLRAFALILVSLLVGALVATGIGRFGARPIDTSSPSAARDAVQGDPLPATSDPARDEPTELVATSMTGPESGEPAQTSAAISEIATQVDTPATAPPENPAVDAALERVEQALAEQSLAAAAAALNVARGISPDDARVSASAARVERAAATALADAQAEPQVEVPGDAPSEAQVDAQVDAQVETQAAASVPAAPEPPGELESLLALARTRLESGQLLEPAGNNALGYFRMAESIDPGASAVSAFRRELATVVAVHARLVLEDGDVDGARALVTEADDLGADPDTLLQLDLDLTAADQRRVEAREASLAASIDQHLRDGQLTDPREDSALGLIDQLATVNPAHPQLAPLRARLQLALAGVVQAAIAAGNWSDADLSLAVLGAQPGAADSVEQLRTELEIARRQSALLEAPARASELDLLVASPARYPEVARDDGIEGWVDVEFVIDQQGIPTSLRVLQAEPVGAFEATALESVASYRYAPYREGGRIYARLMRLRVRFDLE